MDISVIIVSYNVKEFLRGAIESVRRSFAHGNLTGEIIVVDNDSVDGSADLLQNEFSDVRLFALKQNIGFGRANNVGFREAKGDYFLILNPDTIVGEDTLETMLSFMREHPKTGIAGCKLLNGDGSFQLPCRRGFPTPWASFTKLFGLAAFFPKSELFAQYNLTYLPIDETKEVDAVSGAFMVMSREAYQATEGFDEEYFMYGEDLDLCYRTKKAGFSVFYVHSTTTVHFKGESTRRSALNEVRVFYEAMHIFVKKNYSSSWIFTAMLRLGIALRSVVALTQKHRGAIFLMLLDFVTVALSVLLTSLLTFGVAFGLPPNDYPSALIAPALIVVAVLAGLNAYSPSSRRSIRPILVGLPIALIGVSSLTYFFKEFASSRSLVLSNAGMNAALLVVNRFVLRIIDRVRYGGEKTARPTMRRTLVVGTTAEALRVAELLRKNEFIRRYQVLGLIDHSLTNLGAELLPGVRVVGDLAMLGKIARDENVSEVIFASDAITYADMLLTMQRVSDEYPSRIVNFNVIPTASDVLLGRQKIEVLSSPEPMGNITLMPLQYNVQRFSHRAVKRLIDLSFALIAYPFLLLARLIGLGNRDLVDECVRVISGELSLVGVAGSREGSLQPISKVGVTSLAAITLAMPEMARPEDVEQLDLYYARNHTIGMDFEILARALFSRGKVRR